MISICIIPKWICFCISEKEEEEEEEEMNARQVFDEMHRQLDQEGSFLHFDDQFASTSSHNPEEFFPALLMENQDHPDGIEQPKPEHNNNTDFQHKRAKVHSNYNIMKSHYDSALATSTNSCTDRSHNVSLGSSHPFGNEMVHYLNSNQENGDKIGDNEDHMDSSGANSEMEDSEARMDLTDDLLHMVLSFLDHIDLCRSARVCKQWRTASAHEDFWKCLNFENRNISSLQCESSVAKCS